MKVESVSGILWPLVIDSRYEWVEGMTNEGFNLGIYNYNLGRLTNNILFFSDEAFGNEC